MSNNYWETIQTSNPNTNERKPRYWLYALIAGAVAVAVFVVIGIALAFLFVAATSRAPQYSAQLAPIAPIQNPAVQNPNGAGPAAAMPQFPGSAMPGINNVPETPMDAGNPQLQNPYEQRQRTMQGAAGRWGGALGTQMPQQQGGVQYPPVYNGGDVLSDPEPPEGEISEW